MASIFRHIGLDLTPQNSDPVKIRYIGAPELKQPPKGNFRGPRTQFCCVATHFNLS